MMSILSEAMRDVPTGWTNMFISQKDTLHRIDMILREDDCQCIDPPINGLFDMYKMILPDNIKVIIIGNGPYDEPGISNSMAFSSNCGENIPKTLSKIFDEIGDSYQDWERPDDGDLSRWVSQGVFLLNTSLTRDASIPSTSPEQHIKKKLWLPFIIATISYIKSKNKDVIFVTWGYNTKDTLNACKFKRIDKANHFMAPYPGTFKNKYGDSFEGCGHFKNINDRLECLGWSTIDW
jgi:uracil-DNA glycosylase